MAIIKNNDIIQKTYFTTNSIQFILDTEDGPYTINIPNERLGSFSINENFEQMYFPLFTAFIALENSIYYKIMDNKDNCKVHLRIDKFIRDTENGEKKLKRKFINHTFLIIMDEVDWDYRRQSDQKEMLSDFKSVTDDDTNDLHDVTNIVKFYLFPEIIDNTKNNVDKVFTECTVADVLTWIFYNHNISNVLMKQPDNDKIYDEFIIPPLSVLKALSFIDTYYGIYKKGSMMFFGLWYNYVLPYEGKISIKPYNNDKEEIDIIIPTSENPSESGLIKSMSTDKIDYISAHFNSVNVINASVSNNYINANNLHSIDSFSKINKVFKSEARHRGKQNFTRFFSNKTENKDLPYAYIAQTNALSDIVYLNFNDVDPSIFLPYKKIDLLFEDRSYAKEYRGNYILSEITHNFISKGTEFSVTTSVTVKKDTLKL